MNDPSITIPRSDHEAPVTPEKQSLVTSMPERERKIPLSDATSSLGYYGVTPESPDGKRLVYTVFPDEVKDLTREGRNIVYPGQLWIGDIDGTNHRKLFEGLNQIHDGFHQSWVDNRRIVFASGGNIECGEGNVYIINVDTEEIEYELEGFYPGHCSLHGKVVMSMNQNSGKYERGLWEFDVAEEDLRLILPFDETIHHHQYSHDGKRIQFNVCGPGGRKHNRKFWVNTDGSELTVLPGGDKPMHCQWFDEATMFGSVDAHMTGVDLAKHHIHEVYRWDLQGNIIEHLAGIGCHPVVRSDGMYIAGEPWYQSSQLSLWLYERGSREPLHTIYSHQFSELVWGPRVHVNPAFSQDGKRLYYNKAVSENLSQAFVFDLTGLVKPLNETAKGSIPGFGY